MSGAHSPPPRTCRRAGSARVLVACRSGQLPGAGGKEGAIREGKREGSTCRRAGSGHAPAACRSELQPGAGRNEMLENSS